MGTTRHVFDYLARPASPAAVTVLFGDEPFLKRLALRRLRAEAIPDEDVPVAEFEGASVEWRDVVDELRTVSLFAAAGPRVVVISGADEFVRTHRSRLEEYVEASPTHGVLILEVSKWAANTRLYRLVDKLGMQIECRAPQIARGRQKVLDTAGTVAWMVDWARTEHQIVLAQNAARLLLEMKGSEFGLLDQEMAKLALYAGPKGRVSERLVRDISGGWQAKTAWELVDAGASGDAAEALRQLDRLLQSGEHPMALFGPVSWSLRRFAAATRVVQRAERQGKRIKLADALERAGFFKWQPEAIRKAERQLKQLGRERAARLYRSLLETDLALKGTHSAPEMARFALERLFLQMSNQMAPHRKPR